MRGGPCILLIMLLSKVGKQFLFNNVLSFNFRLGLLSSPNSVPNYSAIGGGDNDNNDAASVGSAASIGSSGGRSSKKSRGGNNKLSSSVPGSRKNSRSKLISLVS